jgi:phenylacetate-CoA ligase
MPFVRYSIEDMGAWSALDACPCGRGLPLMESVQGRTADMFRTRDGRSVWLGIATPLFAIEGVRQFQLVQKTLDLVVVRIVKDGPLDENGLAGIERTLHTVLGDQVKVTIEFPDNIPVLDSGKYRYIISELKP